MAYLIAGAAFVTGLVKKNSKYILFIIATVIFFLFGFSTKTADLQIYLNRFYNYKSVAKTTELLFDFVMNLCNRLHMDYQQWVMVLALIYTVCMVFVCLKLANKNPAFPAAMMIMFPLCMDATQQRQTFATCFGWIAVMCLCMIQNRRKAVLIFTGLCIIASLIHISCIFFFLLILVRFFDIKKLVLIVAAIIIVLSVLGSTNLRNLGYNFFAAEKINRVYSMGVNTYGFQSQINAWIRMIVIFLSYLVPFLYTKYTTDIEVDDFSELVMKMHVMMLATMPLIVFTVDFYRVQQVLILISYCAIANWLAIPRHSRLGVSINKRNFCYISISVIFAFANLYLLVLKSNNINTVFRAFFENNILLK